MSKELTQDQIFITFTEQQKGFIKSRIPDFMDAHELQKLFGEKWEVECVGVCLYVRRKHTQSDRNYEFLFEAVKVDSTIHLRCSVDNKVVDSHSALSINRELLEIGVEESVILEFIKVFTDLERCFNEPDAKLFQIKWHD